MENDPQTLEEIEAEILAILEDCRKKGLGRDEIREIFSPLGCLPDPVSKETLSNSSDNNVSQEGSNSNEETSSNKDAVGGWKKTFMYIAMIILIGAFTVHYYEEELKGVRFHVLAITRIALIKVGG